VKKYYIISLIFVLLSALLVTPSCNKSEKQQGLIPTVYVNFELYPNSINPIPVSTWIYVNDQGYRGIIVYRYDQNTFLAYERTCPYDPEKECAVVEADESSITAVDSCCMSRFLLTDGSPFAGPATLPLKQYQTVYDGMVLRVYNQP
jgi:nitrite reductase/ring-hydroxylating ferredoxin subunit